MGDWRGRTVTVTAGKASVRVMLVDCLCSGTNVIDLYGAPFAGIAALSAGLVDVSVSWTE